MSESELQGNSATGDSASSRRDEELEYLKGYVRNHPGNRMAWFLLGKAYTGKGMDAKANYCYLKSGSIYEAYENSIHPLMLEDKSPHEILESWNRKRNRRKAAIRLLLSAVVGLLLLLLLAPKLEEGAKTADAAADIIPQPSVLSPGAGAGAPAAALPQASAAPIRWTDSKDIRERSV